VVYIGARVDSFIPSLECFEVRLAFPEGQVVPGTSISGFMVTIPAKKYSNENFLEKVTEAADRSASLFQKEAQETEPPHVRQVKRLRELEEWCAGIRKLL
jgi:hypothetical protein